MYTETGSTFTHNGVEYDLNKIFKCVLNKKVRWIKIKSIDWIFKYDKPKKNRVLNADPNVPIIVMKWGNSWVIVDGLHRTAKQKLLGEDSIRCKVITEKELEKCEVNK